MIKYARKLTLISILVWLAYSGMASAAPISSREPALVMVNKEIPIVTPGDTVIIPISFRFDNWVTKSVEVEPILGNSESPFEAVEFTSKRYVDRLQPYEFATVELRFRVASEAKPGTYPLEMQFTYSNEFGNTFTRHESVYVQVGVDNGSSIPHLSIHEIDILPSEVVSGANVEVSLTVKNTGSCIARNVVLSIQDLSESFTLLNTTNKLRLGNISAGGSKVAKVALATAESISPGSNRFKVIISYSDDSDQDYSSEEIVFIPIKTVKEEEIKEPKPIIRDVQLEPAFLQPGSLGELSLVVDNVGEGEASAIQIALSGLQGAKLALREGTNVRYVDSLAAGKTTTVAYQLLALEEIDTESAMLTVEITCQDESGAEYRQAQDLFVPVVIPEEEEETAEETVPKIVASEFTTAPEIVKAGNSFTLQIGFTNTHEDKSIRNAKVSLEDSRNVLAPIGSSNTLYISSIAPGSTVYRELQLQAHPDAQPDIYEIVLNIEYEDADGNQYTAEESAGIAIMQQASLSTGTVRLDEAVAGKPTTLYVEFYNTGRSKIYSLMVTAAGEDLMIDAPTYFVGNFEAGSSDYFQTDVIATTPGKYEGEVVFTYEDAAGEKYELRRPFTVYADEATSFTPTLGGSGSINTDKPQDIEETEKEGLSVQLYILLGSLVLLAGVGIIFLLQRRRNKDVLIND